MIPVCGVPDLRIRTLRLVAAIVLGVSALGALIVFGTRSYFERRRLEREAARAHEDEAVRATVERFLDAMARGDFEAAALETTGLPAGDVEAAGRKASAVWGRAWSLMEIRRTVGAAEWPIVEGDISGSDDRLHKFIAWLKPDAGWKITKFVTREAELLPFVRAVEAEEAMRISDIRVAGREESSESWTLLLDVDVHAPSLGFEGRWIRRGVMLRPRVVDPRGQVHDGYGGVSSTWDADPKETGFKTLRESVPVRKEWGAGKYQIRMTAEDRSAGRTSRDLEIELP